MSLRAGFRHLIKRPAIFPGPTRRVAASSRRSWSTFTRAGAGGTACGLRGLFMTGGLWLANDWNEKWSLCFNAYDVQVESEDFPEVVPVFIEVAKGSRMKYEWDSSIGFLRLDRVLHSAVFYPHDYGFIPQTKCDDGDPLDVLVLGDTPLEPGSIVDVRVIGYMVMEDEKGQDEKVLGVLNKDPRFTEIKSLRDVPEHILREISHFFESYKVLEREKWVKTGGWKGTQETKELIEKTHKVYQENKLAAAARG